MKSRGKPHKIWTVFLLSLAICVAGVGGSIALGNSAGGWWPLPLFVTSGLAAYLIWKSIRWDDGWTKYLSFGAVVLIGCMANRVLYSADLWLSGDRLDEWPFAAFAPETAVRKAEFATMLGTLLTVVAWYSSGGTRHSPGAIAHGSNAAVARVLAMTYALSLLGIVLTKAVPSLVRGSGQLVPIMLRLGLAASFYLPFVVARHRAWRLGVVSVMTIPFLYVALGTGMKEDIILALLPAGYLLWTYSQRTAVRLAVATVSFVVVAQITSYVAYYRGEVWVGDRSVNQDEVLTEFIEDTRDDGMTSVTSGLEAFLRRSNAAQQRGWAISLADERRHEPELVFSPMVYVFVPRALWADKPEIRQGWEYSGLLYGAESAYWSTSSSSAGLFSGFYLGQGWTAVVLGGIGIGLLMSALGRLAHKFGGPTMFGLFTFCMLPYALRIDETWTVGALSGPIISFIYIYVLVRCAGALSSLLGTPALVRARDEL